MAVGFDVVNEDDGGASDDGTLWVLVDAGFKLEVDCTTFAGRVDAGVG